MGPAQQPILSTRCLSKHVINSYMSKQTRNKCTKHGLVVWLHHSHVLFVAQDSRRSRARKVRMVPARKVQGRRHKQTTTVRSRKRLKLTKRKQQALLSTVRALLSTVHFSIMWRPFATIRCMRMSQSYHCENARPTRLNTVLRRGLGSGESQTEQLLAQLVQLSLKPPQKREGVQTQSQSKNGPTKTSKAGPKALATTLRLRHALQKVVGRAQKQPGALLTCKFG